MKVGYQTTVDKQYKSIQADGLKASPVLISVAQKKDNMEKYIVWHIEGGLGKNVAATALLPSLAKKYKDRKIIIVASYPEVFLSRTREGGLAKVNNNSFLIVILALLYSGIAFNRFPDIAPFCFATLIK